MLLYTLPYLVNDLVEYMKSKGSILEYKEETDNVTALFFTLTSNQFVSTELVSLRLRFKHVYLNLIDVEFYARREHEVSAMGDTASKATSTSDQEGVHLHAQGDGGSGACDNGSVLEECECGSNKMDADNRRLTIVCDVHDKESQDKQVSASTGRPGQLHKNSVGRSKPSPVRR